MTSTMIVAERTYLYRAYRLLIAATIPIPEMMAADVSHGMSRNEPDVVIAVGSFPDALVDPIYSSAVHQVNAEALLLRVAGVARYLIRGGREILIDPDPAATAHDVRVYLLGTCLGALLHQRGHLVLHASGVATTNGCVLFAGASGAGKSTLLAEFLRRGYRMVVDDVCAVRFDEADQPIVLPSYPRTRLWSDAADRFNVDTSNLPRTRPDWDKFERQVTDQFADQEAKLTHVFLLSGINDGPDLLEQIGPLQAFGTLVDHTYRPMLLDGLGLRANHFALVGRTAKSVQVFALKRSRDSGGADRLAARIIDILGE